MQLTFVVISYNERQYLSQAIESCLRQEIEDSEIIIADDGSDDGSIELIREYAEKYPDKIRYLVHDRSDVVPGKVIAPFRVSNNIKRALAMARGRYCQILSGDDYFYPGKFSATAVDFLENHPAYSTYVGIYDRVWEDQPKVTCSTYYPHCLYWAADYLHLSCFVFRKSLFDNGGFLPRFCDDTGLHYSMAVAGKWHFSKEVVMAYRQRSGSIMHQADILELYIMELMQLQDVLSVGKLYNQSLTRFAPPLRYVFKHRTRLSEPKYQKYVESCASYPNDILAEYAGFDEFPLSKKSKILLRILWSQFLLKSLRLFMFPKRVYRKLRKTFSAKN